MSKVIKLTCTDCGFRKRVAFDGENDPSKLMVQHGKATGHKISISTSDE